MPRSTPLIAALLLAPLPAHAEPAGAPAPASPDCPWDLGSFELLAPHNFIPANASFWIRDYTPAGGLEVRLSDRRTSSSVPLIVETTSIAAPSVAPGRLLRVRPERALDVSASYQLSIRFLDQALAFESFIAIDEDHTPPAPPELARLAPITTAFDLCPTAGIVAATRAGGKDEMLFAESESGELYEATRAETRVVGVSTDPHVTVTMRLVAVDAAGNRSAALPAAPTTAGEVVPPVAPPLNDCSASSCACGGDAACLAGMSPPLSLLLAIGALRLRRRW